MKTNIAIWHNAIKKLMVQIHFINIKEISVSYGFLGLQKKFNINILIDNKPGVYAVEFFQAGNPSKMAITWSRFAVMKF